MTHLWVCLGISLALSVGGLTLSVDDQTSIVSVRLEVFDLSGREVFSSGPVPGATYKWYLQRDDGRPVANGVYLYIFFIQTADGKELRSSVGKLAVRR
uniref:FlgD Ig-like domain-containing protein n=2 Tax=Candidatus Bipolaricaulota TaxID=67810 RepID=H5SPS6_9BACT|nr:hypothetical protein HGMM_F35B12C14 [uncultured Acetothermia bacterium]BAL58162.1 hypothetical protein HGMM_F54G04C03 [uncultured Acetothermia bacterium]BAL59926.1 hypothetical protein HGMM_OP4C562 [Candidatus Acetothermum autotrophicum]